jgi:hypothetical protein
VVEALCYKPEVAASSPDEVDFSIDLMLPATLWPLGSTEPLTEMSTKMLTTLPPSVSRLCIKNMGASTSHNPMGLHGLLHGWFTFNQLSVSVTALGLSFTGSLGIQELSLVGTVAQVFSNSS